MIYTKDNKIIKEILDWALHIAIAFAIGLLIVTFVAQRTVVYNYSMEPTLYEGDNLITEKITPMLGIFKRGDIITIKDASFSLSESGKTIIKRIVALENDVVNISNGKLYINGELINEGYIKGDFTMQVDPQYSKDYVVPEGCVYVLGDNRGAGIIDSRSIGPISTEKINSKAIMIIYPFNRFGILGR